MNREQAVAVEEAAMRVAAVTRPEQLAAVLKEVDRRRAVFVERALTTVYRLPGGSIEVAALDSVYRDVAAGWLG